MAENAFACGYAGADRWSEHQRATVHRLRNLVEIFDDPKVADGAMIRLAVPAGRLPPVPNMTQLSPNPLSSR